MLTLRDPDGVAVMVQPHFVVAAYSCTSRRMPSIGSPQASDGSVLPFLVSSSFHFPGCSSGNGGMFAAGVDAAAPFGTSPPLAAAPAFAAGGCELAPTSFDPGQGSYEYAALPSLPTHLWIVCACAPAKASTS